MPAWPMGMQTNSTAPQWRRRAVISGSHLACFSSRFSTQPRSLQNPISMRSSAHSLRQTFVGGGLGKSGGRCYGRCGVMWQNVVELVFLNKRINANQFLFIYLSFYCFYVRFRFTQCNKVPMAAPDWRLTQYVLYIRRILDYICAASPNTAYLGLGFE